MVSSYSYFRKEKRLKAIEAYLIKLYHIWMSNFLKYVNLSCDSLHVTLVLDSVFLENFDGNLLARDRVRPNPHLAERPRAQRPAYKYFRSSS